MVIKRLCYMGIVALAVLCDGCIASHVRTGEVGLLTKRQFQIASAAYHANDSGMNMFAVVAVFLARSLNDIIFLLVFMISKLYCREVANGLITCAAC